MLRWLLSWPVGLAGFLGLNAWTVWGFFQSPLPGDCRLGVARSWDTGRVTRTVLSGDMAAHQLSPHAPRENFLKARFVPLEISPGPGCKILGRCKIGPGRNNLTQPGASTSLALDEAAATPVATDSSTCFLISTLLLRELSRNQVSKKTLGRRSRAKTNAYLLRHPTIRRWPIRQEIRRCFCSGY